MEERYRKDYVGEFVVTNTSWNAGSKNQERVWIENPIADFEPTDRCVVVSNGSSIPPEKNFPLKALENHIGGLHGSLQMQSYGVHDTWKKFYPHFYIENNAVKLKEIVDAGADEKTQVYANARNCLKFPGHLYLLPYNFSSYSNEVQALYLACFNEHKELYILGYEFFNDKNEPIQKLINEVSSIISAYADTKFIFVTENEKNIAPLRKFNNVSVMKYRSFISHCDI